MTKLPILIETLNVEIYNKHSPDMTIKIGGELQFL